MPRIFTHRGLPYLWRVLLEEVQGRGVDFENLIVTGNENLSASPWRVLLTRFLAVSVAIVPIRFIPGTRVIRGSLNEAHLRTCVRASSWPISRCRPPTYKKADGDAEIERPQNV